MKSPRLFLHSLPRELFGPALNSSALVDLSKRALALAEPCDAVLLESEPDAGYLEYLATLGRGPGQIFVPEPLKGTLAERVLADEKLLATLRETDWIVEPYFAGKSEQDLAQAIGSKLHGSMTDVAERVNHKALLGELLAGASLPNVTTKLVERSALLHIAESQLGSGPLIVRADVGIGGSGVFVLREAQELQALELRLAAYRDDHLFLVQPLLEVRFSPNVQYDLTETKAKLLGASDQRLRDGIHHVGNLSPFTDPSRTQVLEQGQKLAEHVRSMGYRGYLGIDFIVTTENQAIVIELNPRLNTSSFGWLALGNNEELSMLCLSSLPALGVDSFAALHSLLEKEAWIGPERQLGLLPILPPSADRAKVDLVALGSSKKDAEARAESLLEALRSTQVVAGEAQ